MDSINKNQPEENHKDLSGTEAIAKITELVKQANSCFFCTSSAGIGSKGTRPMSVQKTDEQGNLWFLSATDSHKNKEILIDPVVKLYFQGSAHSDFLTLQGNASITQDKTIIKELWEPVLKTWFTDGIDDPRISAIKVEPTEGYYWDTKHGNAVAGIKMLVGAAIGKTLDDSIEG
ncbi:MAG: pyridoxamine 5'-phosphate oxidase family protein, partial [Cytophagales bacterium]|nr:pyridoxamine 5'-phosphate oxidase family protein [Cytophaga sp.]